MPEMKPHQPKKQVQVLLAASREYFGTLTTRATWSGNSATTRSKCGTIFSSKSNFHFHFLHICCSHKFSIKTSYVHFVFISTSCTVLIKFRVTFYRCRSRDKKQLILNSMFLVLIEWDFLFFQQYVIVLSVEHSECKFIHCSFCAFFQFFPLLSFVFRPTIKKTEKWKTTQLFQIFKSRCFLEFER